MQPLQMLQQQLQLAATASASASASASLLILLAAALALTKCNTAAAQSARGSTVEFTIQEELPVNTKIGSVKAQFESRFGPGTQNFRIFQTAINHKSLFKVESETGAILVASLIDRDLICGTRMQCSERFGVYSGDFGKKVEVEVHISDKNDNAPTWSDHRGGVRVEFRDGDAEGTEHPLPAAEDADLGENGTIRYHLANSGAPFALVQGPLDGALKLRVTRPIDHEEQSSYVMNLTAIDGGQLSSSIKVEVKVVDINDHRPEFTKSVYHVPVLYEDEPVGKEVVQLSASDRDSGRYGAIEFGFSGLSSSHQRLAQKYFRVQKDGKILIKSRLDYDTMINKFLYFEVIAWDTGRDTNSRKTATATVSVTIGDRVDEPPSILTCFLPSGCVPSPPDPSILEGSPVGTKIAEVTVTDLDTNDRVQCRTIRPRLARGRAAFRLERHHSMAVREAGSPLINTFDLVSDEVFDRETSESVQFAIMCNDTKTGPQKKYYTVKIADVNDNAPTEKRQILFKAVEEDKLMRPLPGSLLNFMQDADIGRNKKMNFTLHPSDSDARSLFSLNALTGTITPLVAFDREAKDSYTMRVIVSDRGNPPLSTTVTATVSISDINDNPPVFTRQEYRLSVMENVPPMQSVGTVAATDSDVGRNAAIRYYVAKHDQSEGDDSTKFSIDRQSGLIRTISSLDREHKPHYSFRVLAIDSASHSKQKTGTCLISVKVNDANDNKPQFRVSPQHPAAFSVDKREPGHSIGKLLAEDADEGDNGEVEYELVNRSELSDYFNVDPHTGLLLINKALHSVHQRKFLLKVRACDRGRPPKCSEIAEYTADIVDRKEVVNPGGNVDPGVGSGAGGYGMEIVIVCLSAMFLILGVVTIFVICLFVRRRSTFAKKPRHPPAGSAAAHELDSADLKMMCASGTYDLPPAYKDFSKELINPVSHSGRNGTIYKEPRYYAAGVAACASTSEDSLQLYQQQQHLHQQLQQQQHYHLHQPQLQNPDLQLHEQLQQQQQQQYQPLDAAPLKPHTYYEIRGDSNQMERFAFDDGEASRSATLSRSRSGAYADGEASVPDGIASAMCVDAKSGSQLRPQFPRLSPFTEASFV